MISINSKRIPGAKDEDIELLTLKQFMKVFEFDKFGERACKTIRAEIEENMNTVIAKQNAKMRDY